MTHKLSEEEQWLARERYGLHKQFNREADAISNDHICAQLGISLGELRQHLSGKKLPRKWQVCNQVNAMVAQRDKKRSLAALHAPAVLEKEYNLTREELREILIDPVTA